MLVPFLVNAVLSILGIILGGYILLAGRRTLWISLGVIGFTVTANLLAILAASLDSGWELADQRRWLYLLIAVAVAALGLHVGRTWPRWAITLVGFAAGADIALWLHKISFYILTTDANLSKPIALWFNIIIILVGGLLGVWLTRRYGDEILIIITVVIGVEIIYRALSLESSSSFTAVIILSLCLVGVVVQYADYLRLLRVAAPIISAEPALPEIFPPDFFE